MAKQLEETILDDGTRFVHFFEGRILSGRDLRDQQIADRRQRSRLGRAIGAGIVDGLRVEVQALGDTTTPPTLKILPGLALNCEGQTLELCQEQNVELVRTDDDAADGSEEVFGPCMTQPDGVELPNGVGFYVLTLGPASGFQEKAPKSGLEDSGTAAGCGRRYATLGVQFRLIRFDPTTMSGVSTDTRDRIVALAGSSVERDVSRLRNIVAHLFLGTAETRTLGADPFATAGSESAFLEYGALDDLGGSLTCKELEDAGLLATLQLSPVEVPLAVLYWTLDGIGWVDLWSVRRTPSIEPPSRDWPLVASRRRRAEAEARLFQFQEQLAGLSNPSAVQAVEYFRYIPPTGVLRLDGGRFDHPTFFTGLPTLGPISTRATRFLPLLQEGFAYDAIDLDGLAASPPEASPIILYSFIESTESGGNPPHVLFATEEIGATDALRLKCEEIEASLEARIEALEDALNPTRPGIIQGVVRAITGGPVPGVQVQLAHDESGQIRTTLTNASGRFRAVNLAPGSYTLTAGFIGFPVYQTTVELDPGETEEVTLWLPQFNLGAVEGTILGEDNAAVAGANVTLIHEETGFRTTIVADERGHYRMTGLEPGSYRVAVEGDAFDTVEMRDVNVGTGSRNVDVTLNLRNG